MTRNQNRTIAVVTSYPFEDTNAAKARVSSFRAALESLGDVVILCRAGAPGNNGPGFITVDHPGTPRGLLRRGLSELWFALRMMSRLRQIRPAIAVVTVPSIFLLAFASISRFPVIFDVRDLVWDYLPENSLVQQSTKRLLRKWAIAMLGRVRNITVTNPAEQAYLRGVLPTTARVDVLANGLSRERFDALCSGLQAKAPAAQRRRVLYVGNVGLAQDLETLLRAAEKRPELDFMIVGTGNDLSRITSIIAERNIANVELAGGMSWDKLMGYYRAADLLYAQIGTQYSTAVPSKLAEYMVVGRPLVFGGVGAAAEWLGQFSGTVVIPPSDPDVLAEALGSITPLAGLIDVEANRRLIEAKYLRDDQATIMAEIVRSMLARELEALA